MDTTASSSASAETNLQYWRRVAGGDLMQILKAAGYQDPAIKHFIEYFTT